MFKITKFYKIKNLYLDKISSNGNIDTTAMLFSLCIDYYEYTRGSYSNFLDVYKVWIDNFDHDEIMDWKIVSSIFGIYTNGSVSLENLRNLNSIVVKKLSGNDLIEFKKYRDEHRGWVISFKNKRNLVTAHPKNNKGVPEYIIQLGTYGTGGATFYKFFKKIDLNNKEVYRLEAYIDMNNLYRYIEGLLKFYEKAFNLTVVT